MDIRTAFNSVHNAWSSVPAPPEIDMVPFKYKSAKEFIGVAPVDVDIESRGFSAATPLFDLPNNAAAAYLGTYILSLLQELEFQEKAGFFDDIVTRSHTVTALTQPNFWHLVIRSHLSEECRNATNLAIQVLIERREDVPLDDEQVGILKRYLCES